jgi:DNA-binding PadR family transcriptional regulator
LTYIEGRYIVTRMVRQSEPLSTASYFILAALLDGPLHGYGIIKRAAELSEGRVRLAAGTLYGALDRLAERGLVLPGREEVVEGRTRRYYRLTEPGAAALAAEAARLEQAARVVTRRSRSAATTPRPA